MCVSCKKETAKRQRLELQILHANPQSNAIVQITTQNVITAGDGTGKILGKL